MIITAALMIITTLPVNHAVCNDSTSWNSSGAASGQSTLAGLLAGFVFACIVAILTVGPSHKKQAAGALKLLFCAFFGLAVAAYLLADQAADKLCLRENSESALTGSMLATFSITMIISLTWLTTAYDMQNYNILRFLRHLIYFASGFVSLLLCTSSVTYLQSSVIPSPSQVTTYLMYACGIIFFLAGIFFGSRRDDSRVRPRNHHEVDTCAWGALLYLIAAGGGDGILLSMGDNSWKAASASVIYVIAWAALLAPLALQLLALRALPPVRKAELPVKKPASETGLLPVVQPGVVAGGDTTVRSA